MVDAPRPMDSFKSDYKQQVLAAVDIVDLIGKSVPLKRVGGKFLGLCPFHSEKSPSFNVDPSKRFFYCFGCKASGNAIDFVMKRDRLEFMEAMRLLGDAAGIERPNVSPQARQQAGQRQQLLDACSTAAGLFQKLLAHPSAGAVGRAYLAERGFNDEIVQRFQIGLAADGWDRLLRAEPMRKFGPAVMAAAGLVKSREGGNGFYDTFRNRLMFPIRDEAGRVIAFGGRILPGSTDKAKYLNSPETPLFSKSRTVFGLDQARQKIVETRTVAVVEGYADVVMAHQYGATNVVSPLGTALTESHVTILRRFADKIVLLFDADSAGDTAVNRAVELFLTQPVEIAIASLPDGMDPDEYLLAHGLEAFNNILAAGGDPLTVKERQLGRKVNGSGQSLTDRQRIVEEFVELLARTKGSENVDLLRWQMGFRSVSRQIGMKESELQSLLDAKAKIGFRRPPSDRLPPSAGTVPVRTSQAGGPLGGGYRRKQSAVEAYLHPDKWAVYRNKDRRTPSYGLRSGDGSSAGGPIGAAAAALRANQLTARDRAERCILAVLLAEPHRWAGLVDKVHVTDFTDPQRLRLAELYWQQQQDEGEPVFNEFLDVLRAASTPTEEGGSSDDLVDLAIGLDAELTARVGQEDAPVETAVLLNESVALIEEMRSGGEQAKLMAQLRRTSGTSVDAESLRRLSERAGQPDMRRLGT
jgi:DNA primase catalytic core